MTEQDSQTNDNKNQNLANVIEPIQKATTLALLANISVSHYQDPDARRRELNLGYRKYATYPNETITATAPNMSATEPEETARCQADPARYLA